MEQPGYSTSQVREITDAQVTYLKHWPRLGIVTPSIEDTTGTGYPRRWSWLNIIEVALCVRVRDEHRVTADVLRGVASVFRDFHRGAVALFEHRNNRPLATDPADGGGLFTTLEDRQKRARRFVLEQPVKGPDPRVEVRNAAAWRLAEAWGCLRASSLVSGQPDPSWSHFVGLFFNEAEAMVAVDPSASDLGMLVGGSAIVVDLADVVFQVGLRCRQRGVASIGKF